MAYNSSHTGMQIDAAVGAVIAKEKTWDGKQNALTGKAGQVVGFDADGNPKATDAPSGGMTEAEADKKYLSLSGGKMTGTINISEESKDVIKTDNSEINIGMILDRGFPAFSASNDNLEVSVGITANGYAALRFNNKMYGNQNTILVALNGIQISGDSVTISSESETIVRNLSAPTNDTDAANKSYVDALKTKAHKVTLTASGWNSSTKQQTVAVADVVADETAQLILPMPAAASMTAYNDAGIQCVAQAAGKLTFQCDTVPTADIPVYVTITPVAFS